jgi:hypothetical protein
MEYTKLTNLEVTGDLKVDGGVIAAGIEDVDAAAKAAGSAPTKAEFDALVDEVNAIRALMGGTT